MRNRRNPTQPNRTHPKGTPVYTLRIDHRRYTSDPTDPTRTPFTLAAARAAALGCGNAHIERPDGSVVVADAGRAYTPRVHAPTGRTLRTGDRRYPAPHDCATGQRFPVGYVIRGEQRTVCDCGRPAGFVRVDTAAGAR